MDNVWALKDVLTQELSSVDKLETRKKLILFQASYNLSILTLEAVIHNI